MDISKRDNDSNPGVYALDDDARLTLGAALKYYLAALPSSASRHQVGTLAKLLAGPGLTFGALTPLFGRGEDDPYVKAARTYLVEEGCIEIDDPAVVSEGAEDGAYVMGWVWVGADMLPESGA